MRLHAFVLTAESVLDVVPASSRREWMEQSPERFANRCLPLMIANQSGWFLTLREPVECEWNGGGALGDITIFGTDRMKQSCASHFGGGILTFKVPYLFRTEPGYNLHVRGPANLWKDGVAPLEGIVEADWSIAPFTMNWKITRPHRRIAFDAGEPVCMLTPQRRHEVEEFDPELMDLDDDPEISTEYRRWRASRDKFIDDLAARDEGAVKAGWQRDYFLGRGPGDVVVPQHQTKLAVKPFTRRAKPDKP